MQCPHCLVILADDGRCVNDHCDDDYYARLRPTTIKDGSGRSTVHLQDLVDQAGARTASYWWIPPTYQKHDGYLLPQFVGGAHWRVILHGCVRSNISAGQPYWRVNEMQHVDLARGAHLDVETFIAERVSQRLDGVAPPKRSLTR